MGFSCVTYNIQYGVGMDGRYELERIANAVRDADLIAFQEVTRGMPVNGGVDMVAALKSLLPDHQGVFGSPFQIGLEAMGGPKGSFFEFGNMVFSKMPILATRTVNLPRSRTYDQLNLQRCALEALVETPIGPVRFYCVHLDHVSGEERLAQIRYLKGIADGHRQQGGAATGLSAFGFPDLPVNDAYMLMGDFNLEPESAEYIALCGSSTSEFGRPLRNGVLVDVTRPPGAAVSDVHTYFHPKGEVPSKRLDYCFVSAELAPNCGEPRVDSDDVGSDHRPVWVSIS
ncbi:MAG: endonuclease/exonuclease/phosphatase family protein [Pseudomonadota bacterium]